MVSRRAHVVVPEKLIEEVDALVGKRRRSAFFVEAVEDALMRAQRVAAAEQVLGSIPDGAVPEWDTVEGVKQWVSAIREERDPWADVPESG